jgi:salicylate biosynthesis isochorismate synthase/menaquinone-specific isochorismate synthase
VPARAGDRAGASGLTNTALLRRLADRHEQALRRARATGAPVIASVSARLDATLDPSETVVASRRAEDAWFSMETVDRDRAAVAALGCVLAMTAAGPDRFGRLAALWRELAGRAVADAPLGPPGSGLAAFGGFAFAADGGASPRWEGFAPASMVVPECSLARRGGETWITLNTLVGADDLREELHGRASARLSELRHAPLPLMDPAPAGAYSVRSPIPPAHYEEAVRRAVERIRAGELEKVVLARELEVDAPASHDAAAIMGVLRTGFPSCFVYAVGTGAATFIGASPELLVRREGQRASTVSLAGSTRRSADPSVDDHLGEQLLRSEKDQIENQIVTRRIMRALAPHSVWVTAAPEPVVIKVANIQHLAAPIRAQLAEPLSAIDLAGILHPTPAVGGEPDDLAQRLIPALEGFDRGWYAGPLGWTDSTGDGEFCVALRCALLRGRHAWCYAGCGIVAESEPAAELGETVVKLEAMLPLLAG